MSMLTVCVIGLLACSCMGLVVFAWVLHRQNDELTQELYHSIRSDLYRKTYKQNALKHIADLDDTVTSLCNDIHLLLDGQPSDKEPRSNEQ